MADTKIQGKIQYMDIAKALGIIAVVIGHSGVSPIEHFVNLYHMSLFFFISGYFYNDKYTNKPKSILKKRLSSLYKPYLIYELLFLVLHNVFFKLNIYSVMFGFPVKIIQPYNVNSFFKAFLAILVFAGREPMAGVFWFFASLFFTNIIFCYLSYFIEKLFHKNKEYIRFLCIIILFITANLATKYGFNIPRFNNSLTMVLIYYMGYMFRRYEGYINTGNIYLAIISTILLLTSSLYGSVAVGTNSYLSPDFLIGTAVLGIYVNIYISQLIIRKNIFNNMFTYIGKNTVAIMALQFLSFKVVALLQIKVYSLPNYMLAKFPVIDGSNGWFILYTIAAIFLPLLLCFMWERLKRTIRIVKVT